MPKFPPPLVVSVCRPFLWPFERCTPPLPRGLCEGYGKYCTLLPILPDSVSLSMLQTACLPSKILTRNGIPSRAENGRNCGLLPSVVDNFVDALSVEVGQKHRVLPKKCLQNRLKCVKTACLEAQNIGLLG